MRAEANFRVNRSSLILPQPLDIIRYLLFDALFTIRLISGGRPYLILAFNGSILPPPFQNGFVVVLDLCIIINDEIR